MPAIAYEQLFCMTRRLVARAKAGHLLIGLTLFASAVRSADATAIVYVRYPGGYVIAADSLVRQVDSRDVTRGQFYHCKLFIDGTTVFAAAGNIGSAGSPGIDDLSRPVRMSIFGSADSRSKSLLESLTQNQPYLDQLRKSASPSVSWVFIDANDAAEGHINFYRKDFRYDPGGFADALGWPNHTLPFLLRQLHPYTQGTSIINVPPRGEAIAIARRTLLEGMQKDSWTIGGKVSLLYLDSAGVHWIERGDCKDPSR